MYKILLDAGLIMEYSKSEVFHFTRSRHPSNPLLDLTLVKGLLLIPKPI